MSYQVLYRKYRSQRFSDMVGQEVVALTLKNAIMSDHIAHAYLFSGPRGTGKTSAAKIFAKAINCLNPEAGEPCNQCEICEAITRGALDDVIELDAASNNGVDEIREIRDKSTYAATRAKYKVYIIDEVHMLSIGAFNALLKTLEEPSSHVVFVLATTELQKIPATIMSRVQRLAFKMIDQTAIEQHLAHILTLEAVEFDSQALAVIAKNAQGGMRDALSSLEQALAISDQTLTLADALLVTGAISQEAMLTYVAHLERAELSEALEALDKIVAEGKSLQRFFDDLLAYFRDRLLDGQEVASNQIFQWIDIVLDANRAIKTASQPLMVAQVMTMRLLGAKPEAQQAGNSSELIEALSNELASVKAQLRQLETNGLSQAPRIKQSPRVRHNQASYFNQEQVFGALKTATKPALEAVSSHWEELIMQFSTSQRAQLNATKPVAASETYMVVTFQNSLFPERIMADTEFRAQIGNYLSKLVGFAPEMIALTEGDWQTARAQYVAQHHKHQSQVSTVAPSSEVEEVPVVIQEMTKLLQDKIEEVED